MRGMSVKQRSAASSGGQTGSVGLSPTLLALLALVAGFGVAAPSAGSEEPAQVGQVAANADPVPVVAPGPPANPVARPTGPAPKDPLPVVIDSDPNQAPARTVPQGPADRQAAGDTDEAGDGRAPALEPKGPAGGGPVSPDDASPPEDEETPGANDGGSPPDEGGDGQPEEPSQVEDPTIGAQNVGTVIQLIWQTQQGCQSYCWGTTQNSRPARSPTPPNPLPRTRTLHQLRWRSM
jgi:hypothetical protein